MFDRKQILEKSSEQEEEDQSREKNKQILKNRISED